MPLASLFESIVAPFPESKRRPMIWKGFLEFLEALDKWDVGCEVWLDGSFLTHKREPNDLDLVLLVKRQDVVKLSSRDRDALKSWLSSREFLKKNYYCDVYYCDSGDPSATMYWSNWYGLCRDRITPKGIPLVKVNHE